MDKYVSDLITREKFEKWKKGDRILILSPTGSGKTQFILGEFYQYCLQNNLKCIFLMNRILLKKQIENGTKKIPNFNKEIMNIELYQSIEARSVVDGRDAEQQLKEYDIIIGDECHYSTNDSEFSERSDIVLKYVIKDHPEQIIIFMSATPHNLIDVGVIRETKRYTINKNYSDDLERVYFYKKEDTIRKIIDGVPETDKILFFGSAATGLDFHTNYYKETSSFICAKSNPFHRFSSEKEMNNIIEREYFSKRILFTTRVIHNGITIKDENLKHIIIDDSLDIISLIQMIGRKRILTEDDKFNLYVRDHNNNVIQGKINISRLDLGEKVDPELFKEGYSKFLYELRKKNMEDIKEGNELNMAKRFAKEFDVINLRYILELLNGFQDFVCENLGIPEHERYGKKVLFAEEAFRKHTPEEILDMYYGKKLFDNDITQFKQEFLDAILSTKKLEKVGLGVMRGFLTDNNFPFVIENIEETKGEMRKKTYWIVKRIG